MASTLYDYLLQFPFGNQNTMSYMNYVSVCVMFKLHVYHVATIQQYRQKPNRSLQSFPVSAQVARQAVLVPTNADSFGMRMAMESIT